MKDNYKITVKLQCITCGGEDFDFNEDKTYVKCTTCNREYLRGYDELVELNNESISTEVEHLKKDVLSDLKNDFEKKMKDAFRGNKHIKFK